MLAQVTGKAEESGDLSAQLAAYKRNASKTSNKNTIQQMQETIDQLRSKVRDLERELGRSPTSDNEEDAADEDEAELQLEAYFSRTPLLDSVKRKLRTEAVDPCSQPTLKHKTGV